MKRNLVWIVSFVLMAAAPAAAQFRDWGAGSKEAAYRAGFDQGFWEGLRQGERDRYERVGYDYRRTRAYRDGERGYTRSMKHKGDYKKGYREGFESGYSDGYYGRSSSRRGSRRYPEYAGERYPGSRYPSGPYEYGRGRGYSTAYERGTERGYHDGLERGNEDFRKNRAYDPVRHGDYRDADDGYKSSYGSKEEYRQGYRRGFEQGYRQGYRR